MLEALKKNLILIQVVLAITLPLLTRLAPDAGRPALQLTPYTLNALRAELRQPPEAANPLLDRALLIREFHQYCLDHHLPFDPDEPNS